MGKTFQLHLRMENGAICSLKREAEERKLFVSELCREKLMANSKFQKMEIMLEDISKRLKCSNKFITGGKND